MDPNANLAEQQKLVVDLLRSHDIYNAQELDARSRRLSELVQALDAWLSAGGALPSA